MAPNDRDESVAETVRADMVVDSEVTSLFQAAATTRKLPDQHVLELGRLFLNASAVEGSLESLIWKLSGMPPETGRIFTERMPLHLKMARVDELIRQPKTPKKTKDLWKEAVKACCKLQKYRNKFAHGIALDASHDAPDTLFIYNNFKVAPGDTYSFERATLQQTKDAVKHADDALNALEEMRRLP